MEGGDVDPNGSGAGSDSPSGVPHSGSDRQRLEQVVIRFAGDSGDGMQLTGDRFTSEAALFGNDLATQPNYPAEIRAPAGTLPGVSSFQIQIADYDILTAGDRPDVLVAMNPAALKANIGDLPRGGMVIANSDEFTKRNLTKVGYVTNPLETDELEDYVVHSVPMTTLTLGAVEASARPRKTASAPRTCSRWACCRGCMAGRSRPARTSSGRSSSASPTSPRPTCSPLRRAGTTAKPPRLSAPPTRCPRPRCRPANTGRSPATRRWPTALSRPVSWRTFRSCSAATRSRRRRTSCTSCPSTRTST